MYLDTLRKKIAGRAVISADEFVGCSDAEIATLEEQIGLTFPAALHPL